jgi:KTSC domain
MNRWQPLNSSALAAYDYEPERKTLHVMFRDGAEYSYHGVPEHLVSGLAETTSPGNYLRHNISMVYQGRKVR